MEFVRPVWLVIAALPLAACASSGPTPVSDVAADLGQAHWVETQPDVRTLLVAPDRVGPVARPGERAAELSIGSFFARYQSADGPLDQLGLMVVLQGEYATRVLDSGMSLLLEIDGEFFQGEPGLGSNNVHWDPQDGGRATLVIPISREILYQLANAELVRGRVGAYGTFDFPTGKRARLDDVLGGVPDDFNPSTGSKHASAILASMS